MRTIELGIWTAGSERKRVREREKAGSERKREREGGRIHV